MPRYSLNLEGQVLKKATELTGESHPNVNKGPQATTSCSFEYLTCLDI